MNRLGRSGQWRNGWHVMTIEMTDNPGGGWDRFAAGHTDLIFYTSSWSHVLRDGLGGTPCYLSRSQGGEIVSGLPGVILSFGPLKLYYSSIPYGGYLGDPCLSGEFLAAVPEQLRRVDILYLTPFRAQASPEYRIFPEVSNERVTRIALSGKAEGEIVAAWEPSVRQSLNKSAREGVGVTCRRDEEAFLVAHRLYLQTMARNRAIARYPEQWFLALHRHLAADGGAVVYLAERGGTALSATVALMSGSGVHLLHSGSSADHLFLRSNDLIVCTILRDAVRSGKEFLDLMQSDPRDVKLVRWKEKFGGLSEDLPKYALVNSPVKAALWNGAKRLYPFLGSLRRGVR